MPFGFFANIEADIKDYNNKFFKSNIVEFKKFFIAIAGPLLNIVLTFIFANIDGDRANVITYSNLLIFIFNLIPIFPLDGGRALNCLLCIFFGRYKASCVINKISNGVIIFLTVVTSLTILYLKNIAMLFILGYLWFLISGENKKFELQKKIYEYSKNE